MLIKTVGSFDFFVAFSGFCDWNRLQILDGGLKIRKSPVIDTAQQIVCAAQHTVELLCGYQGTGSCIGKLIQIHNFGVTIVIDKDVREQIGYGEPGMVLAEIVADNIAIPV